MPVQQGAHVCGQGGDGRKVKEGREQYCEQVHVSVGGVRGRGIRGRTEKSAYGRMKPPPLVCWQKELREDEGSATSDAGKLAKPALYYLEASVMPKGIISAALLHALLCASLRAFCTMIATCILHDVCYMRSPL
eukprot:1143644-Pelagomonas_calceolata.AAC.7